MGAASATICVADVVERGMGDEKVFGATFWEGVDERASFYSDGWVLAMYDGVFGSG